MLATFGAKLATAVVQPAVQAIAAGLLTGAIAGGALVVTGVVPPADPSTTTALVACPGSGAVVANVPAGQSLLATARTEDATWLQVYIGQPGIDGAWAPAAAVKLQGSIDGLPVADCAAPSSAEPTPQPLPSPQATVVGTILPTLEPSPSPGATPRPTLPPGATPSPTPKPTGTPKATVKPTPTMTFLPPPPTIPPTPSPTPFVDVNAPVVTNITTTGYYDAGNNWYSIFRPSTNFALCGPVPISATVSATITTSDPGDSVTEAVLYYQPSGGAIYSFDMTNTSGTTWQRTIDAQDVWNEGQIVYWIRALDAHGNLSSGYYPSVPYILTLGTCIA